MTRRFCALLLVSLLVSASAAGGPDADDNDPDSEPAAAVEDDVDQVPLTEEEASAEPLDWVTPDPPKGQYFADPFNDRSGIGRRWILSEAKKDGVEETIAKYNGEWEIGSPDKVVLKNDYGLIVKTKARHHAISAKLDRSYVFKDKPFVVQYDVNFQNGQDCGGAYVKLLTTGPELSLKDFQDKTPYSIMFGPDKCGLTSKVHFIVRFKNPKNGTINEHHAKATEKPLETYFTDKKSHLFTLVINPDNSYKILVDQEKIVSGSLLETLQPSIIPPKEIEDPTDTKPTDWDEREKIPDPDAKKPDDWDETAPEMIEDASAKMPDDWLETEPEYVPDEKAEKPDDWDEEMDGKWEAALLKNPKCEAVSGCGAWKPPKVKNPAYKGKWHAPKIENPNYKGKWKARTIPNPHYFEDASFRMLSPVGAVGLELWTMSDGILFDNFLVTDDESVADEFARATWLVKQRAEAVAAGKATFFGGLVAAANERPWLWAVYILVVLIPVVLVTVFCCSGSKQDEDAVAKKTDRSQPDDAKEGDGEEEEAEGGEEPEPNPKTSGSKKGDSSTSSPKKSPQKPKKADLEVEEDSAEEAEESKNKAAAESESSPKTATRRRARKD